MVASLIPTFPVLPHKVIVIREFMSTRKICAQTLTQGDGIWNEVVKLNLQILAPRDESDIEHALQKRIFSSFYVYLHKIHSPQPKFRPYRSNISYPAHFSLSIAIMKYA